MMPNGVDISLCSFPRFFMLICCCRVAIPINRFHKSAEQDVEDWYELGKNDFAADAGTVSLL